MAAPSPVGLNYRHYLPPVVGSRAALMLAALLAGSILALWVPGRWTPGIFEAAVFALAAYVIAAIAFQNATFRVNFALIPLTGAVCLAAFQLLTRQTENSLGTRYAMLAWAAHASLLFLALQLFRDSMLRARLLRWLFYFGFAVSVIAAAQMSTSHGQVFWLFPTGYPDLVMGPFVSPNLFAAFIELLLPIGLWSVFTDRSKWMHAAMCAVMFAAVVAGASRAGFALLTAEVLASFLLARQYGLLRTRSLAISGLLLVAFSAALISILGGTTVLRRLQESDPYGRRREMIRSSIDMTRERPWSGFGLGAWATVYPRFAYYDDGTVTRHAHNDWVEWAAEGGVPLLAMMLVLAAITVRPAVRSIWGLGIVAVWLHCLVDSPLQNAVIAAWFFLLAGALIAGVQEGEPTHPGN